MEALQESELRFPILAETAPCAIVILQGGEARFANSTAGPLEGRARIAPQSVERRRAGKERSGAVEHGPNLANEQLLVERLLDEGIAGSQGALLCHLFVCVP